jgi:hypothetical protein
MDDAEPAASGGVDEDPEESEVVDGVLVLASARTIEPVREAPRQPLRAVAAVAATGFVAGAATAAVLGRRLARHQARRAASALPALRPGGETLDVVSSRRFIVDVHTLARR